MISTATKRQQQQCTLPRFLCSTFFLLCFCSQQIVREKKFDSVLGGKLCRSKFSFSVETKSSNFLPTWLSLGTFVGKENKYNFNFSVSFLRAQKVLTNKAPIGTQWLNTHRVIVRSWAQISPFFSTSSTFHSLSHFPS